MYTTLRLKNNMRLRVVLKQSPIIKMRNYVETMTVSLVRAMLSKHKYRLSVLFTGQVREERERKRTDGQKKGGRG